MQGRGQTRAKQNDARMTRRKVWLWRSSFQAASTAPALRGAGRAPDPGLHRVLHRLPRGQDAAGLQLGDRLQFMAERHWAAGQGERLILFLIFWLRIVCPRTPRRPRPGQWTARWSSARASSPAPTPSTCSGSGAPAWRARTTRRASPPTAPAPDTWSVSSS